VLVSAVNEDLDRMAALYGFQVFWLGFLACSNSYEMGVPAVPLADLYSSEAWGRLANVRLQLRSPVESLTEAGIVTGGELRRADYYVLATPFERLPALAPSLGIDVSEFTHSPITGVHLWFDREITNLPHATLLDRTIQWMFNKDRGRYIQLVISASRTLTEMSRGDVIALALNELGEFFPAAREAKLEKARGRVSNKRGLRPTRSSATCFWPAIGHGAGGRRPWKALCEADTLRPRRSRRRRAIRGSFC
jgi:hypothetical protein